MIHHNFQVGKRYARRDGGIVLITKRFQYLITKTGDYGALVMGDDGHERWDDPDPGFGLWTYNMNLLKNAPGARAMSGHPNDLMLGEIGTGKTQSGPLKIR